MNRQFAGRKFDKDGKLIRNDMNFSRPKSCEDTPTVHYRLNHREIDCDKCGGLDKSTEKLLTFCKIRNERIFPNHDQAVQCVKEGVYGGKST